MKKMRIILIVMLTSSLILTSCSSPKSDGVKAAKLAIKVDKLKKQIDDFIFEIYTKDLQYEEMILLPEYKKLNKELTEAKKSNDEFYDKMEEKYTNEFEFLEFEGSYNEEFDLYEDKKRVK